MCPLSVWVKVQLGVEWAEVCPALAYSLSRAVHGAEQMLPHSLLESLPHGKFFSTLLGEDKMTSGTL